MLLCVNMRAMRALLGKPENISLSATNVSTWSIHLLCSNTSLTAHSKMNKIEKKLYAFDASLHHNYDLLGYCSQMAPPKKKVLIEA